LKAIQAEQYRIRRELGTLGHATAATMINTWFTREEWRGMSGDVRMLGLDVHGE
jgi:hypothetical protein